MNDFRTNFVSNLNFQRSPSCPSPQTGHMTTLTLGLLINMIACSTDAIGFTNLQSKVWALTGVHIA